MLQLDKGLRGHVSGQQQLSCALQNLFQNIFKNVVHLTRPHQFYHGQRSIKHITSVLVAADTALVCGTDLTCFADEPSWTRNHNSSILRPGKVDLHLRSLPWVSMATINAIFSDPLPAPAYLPRLICGPPEQRWCTPCQGGLDTRCGLAQTACPEPVCVQMRYLDHDSRCSLWGQQQHSKSGKQGACRTNMQTVSVIPGCACLHAPAT